MTVVWTLLLLVTVTLKILSLIFFCHGLKFNISKNINFLLTKFNMHQVQNHSSLHKKIEVPSAYGFGANFDDTFFPQNFVT